MNTITTRKNIGFPKQKNQWNHAQAVFDQHTLKIAGHPVMEDWELQYMDALAEVATSKGGTILELGYGMGLSARAIQKQSIETHFVIEAHPDVLSKGFVDMRPAIAEGRLHFMSGFWEDVIPLLAMGSFDGILFDTYPLHEKEVHTNHFPFFKEAYRLLKPGGILTYYSDEAEDFSPSHMKELRDAGFRRNTIRSKLCHVSPPKNCEYWQAKSLLVPIVTK